LAISAVSNPPRICSLARLDLASAIQSAEIKGNVYRTIGFIAAIAFIAIFVFIGATYFALIAPPSFILASLPIAAVACLKAAAIIVESKESFKEADVYKRIQEKLTLISDWQRPQIVEYLTAKGISVVQIESDAETLHAMAGICADEPLKALLPLIARSKALSSERAELLALHAQLQEAFHLSEHDPQLHSRIAKKTMENGEQMALNNFYRAVSLRNLAQPTREYILKKSDPLQIDFCEEINGQEVKIGICRLDAARADSSTDIPIEYPRNFYFPHKRDEFFQPINEETLINESSHHIQSLLFGAT
jgi:hypothetical protein